MKTPTKKTESERALDRRYRNGGTIPERHEAAPTDVLQQMNRAARDPRVLANALKEMGVNSEDLSHDNEG